MIALDTTALSLLFLPKATANTKSGKRIKHAPERMDYLIERLSRDEDAINDSDALSRGTLRKAGPPKD